MHSLFSLTKITKDMKTSKTERRVRLVNQLQTLGFSYEETTKLRRIEGTLHRWAEHECNGDIQRDGENGDGKPYFVREGNGMANKVTRYPVADREAGALKRLAAIMAGHPKAVAYHQGDPRGCALYIVSTATLNGSKIDEVYTRGVAVCD